jgi:DNA polymerase
MNCQRCALAESRYKAVPDNGNFHASIMAIGEAPGRTENEVGLPFVGISGQMLRAKLASIGVDFDSFFITNTCKCYPNQRKPLKNERLSCRYYLIKQIAIIQPELIIPIGGVALDALTTGGHKISEDVGKLQKSCKLNGQEWLLFPIYHPAYIIRRKSELPAYTRQLIALKRFIVE